MEISMKVSKDLSSEWSKDWVLTDPHSQNINLFTQSLGLRTSPD